MLGNRNFRNLLLVILVIGVFVVLLTRILPPMSDGSQLLNSHNVMRGFFLLILLLFVGGAFWRRKFSIVGMSETLKGSLLWLLIFFIVIVGYAFRHELDTFKKRVVAVLIPSYAFVEEGEMILARHADGHFYVNAYANDQATIKFLIDTGASGVAITRQDAINMGFDLKKLSYTQKSSTANGIAYSAPIKIKKLQIGKKTLHNVSAHVTSGGLDISLLGMSVIDDFSDFRFVNDNLILKY